MGKRFWGHPCPTPFGGAHPSAGGWDGAQNCRQVPACAQFAGFCPQGPAQMRAGSRLCDIPEPIGNGPSRHPGIRLAERFHGKSGVRQVNRSFTDLHKVSLVRLLTQARTTNAAAGGAVDTLATGTAHGAATTLRRSVPDLRWAHFESASCILRICRGSRRCLGPCPEAFEWDSPQRSPARIVRSPV